ncbi:hypothetical protein QFZ81_003690 [Paenibacillus sp. V4I9]|uniref:hypothetical protein n=1 Tax=Paenibacillus sp. V4I9 TaxID=3042308 RepID=UPI0027817900|nr:hypothetical protein [Paenibacillus sp. V4I9]MDQ0888602.1 hypothetical protein [Paenibacillus sp. V4I9]
MSNKFKQGLNTIEIPYEKSKIGVTEAKLEMRNFKRRWLFVIVTIIAASFALAIFAPNYFTNNHPENPVVRTIASSNSFDVTDTRRLVGWADNVFVGKVIKQDGTKSLDRAPETQFKVEVSDNVKGIFNGTVIVNQQGGFKRNELILIENDQLLHEGQSYLFVTKHLKEENWNTLVPVYGDILIANEEAKKELIKKYTKAYKNEIPFNMSKSLN